MPNYKCESCDMSIASPVCGKCKAELEHHLIEVDGQDVAVAKCPNECGKIKSPLCCGKDMTPQK